MTSNQSFNYLFSTPTKPFFTPIKEELTINKTSPINKLNNVYRDSSSSSSVIHCKVNQNENLSSCSCISNFFKTQVKKTNEQQQSGNTKTSSIKKNLFCLFQREVGKPDKKLQKKKTRIFNIKTVIRNHSKKNSKNFFVCTPPKQFKRRYRKNKNQIEILKEFFVKKNCFHSTWTKEEIFNLSIRVGMPNNKVYKWLWDQKAKATKKLFVCFKEIEGKLVIVD